MANPNDSLTQSNAPDTPEQVKARELLKAETERKAHERDIASIEAMLDDAPSQEMLEHVLRFILKNTPEKRSELEQLSIGADIELLEAMAKQTPLSESDSVLLQNRKQRYRESADPRFSHQTTKENGTAPENPKDVENSTQKEQSRAGISDPKNANPEGKELENKNLEKKTWQLSLLSSVGMAYRDYLSNIEHNIRFKNISTKPERYQDQIHTIDSVLGNLEAITRMPEASRNEALRSLDISALANRVFVPETKLTNLANNLMNQPVAERDIETGENRIMPNIVSTLAETEGRYDKIRKLIVSGDDFHEASVSAKKYQILELLRANDSRDDDSLRLNTSEAIINQTQGNILANPSLRKNANTKKAFDSVTSLESLESNPKAREALASLVFGEAVPNSQAFSAFFQKQGMELPEQSIADITRKATEYRRASEELTEERKEELSRLVDRPGTFPPEFVAGFKQDPVNNMKELFKEDATNKMLSLLKRETVNNALNSDIPQVEELKNADPALRLYTDIEGIGGHKADAVINERVDTSSYWLEQLLIMASAWLIGSGIARLSAVEKPIELAAQGVKQGVQRVGEKIGEKAHELWRTASALWAWRAATVSEAESMMNTSSMENSAGNMTNATEGGSIAGNVETGNIASTSEAANLAKTSPLWRIADFAGKSTEFAGTTLVEWGTFALIYSTLSGLTKQGYLHKDTLGTFTEVLGSSNKLEDNSRIIAFLAVLKIILPVVGKIPNPQDVIQSLLLKQFPELAGKLSESPAMAKGLEMSRMALQIGKNLTLDTAALLGADTVIRGLKGEDLPKDPSEIPNYLAQEFQSIITYVIGLRMLTNQARKTRAEQENSNIPARTDEKPNASESMAPVTQTNQRENPTPTETKTESEKPFEVTRMDNGDWKVQDPEGGISIMKRESRPERNTQTQQEKSGEETGTVNQAEKDKTRYESSLSWVGTNAKQGYMQRIVPDESFPSTNTNHTANNIKWLDIDPKEITLWDAVSGFSSSPSVTMDTVGIGKQFENLLSDMRNVESPELLQAQAETVIRRELKTKYDEVMKDYDSLTPEAQKTMDTWREQMERQAQELSQDFRTALKTKLEWGKMETRWGNPEYMDRMMGMFVKEMSPLLKQSYEGVKKNKNKKQEEPTF